MPQNVKINKISALFFIVLILFLSSCTSEKNTKLDSVAVTSPLETMEKAVITQTLPEPTVSEDDILRAQIEKMTLAEKVGQMFIVAPEVFSQNSTVTDISQIDSDMVNAYNIGGFIMFGKNIVNPAQITALNQGIKNIDPSLFISVDEEGGVVSRISKNPNFPDKEIENMSEIGANNDVTRASEVGLEIGEYLKRYGFNLDFAPLCDVLVNSQNTVVRDRSFGNDPAVVSDLSLRIMEGLHSNQILASAKHFPGHGNTAGDTHDGFATSSSTYEQMMESELVPFKNMVENNVDLIMVSHVLYPNLSTIENPATLNHDIVTKLLQEDLGYNGVIITDAMNMGAIINNYSVEYATVTAVSAGIDIILMPPDFYTAYESLITAVENGTIEETRIDDSVFKILKLKQKL